MIESVKVVRKKLTGKLKWRRSWDSPVQLGVFHIDLLRWIVIGKDAMARKPRVRDPLKFPDLNHAVKRDPRTNLRSAKNNWDFWTSLPEALHQVSDSIKT
jgi:hypothetical protein